MPQEGDVFQGGSCVVYRVMAIAETGLRFTTYNDSPWKCQIALKNERMMRAEP